MNRYIALQKIVELGSFTKAADILGYTQPAISLMISSLEKELSIKLLYRSRYGIHLTLEGEQNKYEDWIQVLYGWEHFQVFPVIGYHS